MNAIDNNIKKALELGVTNIDKAKFSFGEINDEELTKIVTEHALAASAISFIPVPGADIAALVGNIWVMYARLNEAVSISFGENFLKSIASGVLANVLSTVPSLAIAAGAGSILKVFPGIGTGGGIMLGLMANIAIMYVAGMIYIKSLKTLAKSGKVITEENIKQVTRNISKDKEFIKNTYEKGKVVAKQANK